MKVVKIVETAVLPCLMSCLWLLWAWMKFQESPYEEFGCFLRGEFFSCAGYFSK
jgi:hypothetical protein